MTIQIVALALLLVASSLRPLHAQTTPADQADDSIASLYATDESELKHLQQSVVNRFHASTKIGGGTFFWDATGEFFTKADHDGGIVIDPSHANPSNDFRAIENNSGLGVWVRTTYQDYDIRPEWFGALPNEHEFEGVSQDDWSGLQQAIDIASRRKKRVELTGEYSIKKTLVLPSHSHLRSGGRAVVTGSHGAAALMLIEPGTQHVRLAGITLQLDREFSVNTLLRINGQMEVPIEREHDLLTREIRIYNCEFRALALPGNNDGKTDYGILVMGRHCHDIKIDQCKFENLSNGFHSNAILRRLEILNCCFTGWRDNAIKIGKQVDLVAKIHAVDPQLDRVEDVRIIHNRFQIVPYDISLAENGDAEAIWKITSAAPDYPIGSHTTIQIARPAGNLIRNVQIVGNQIYGPAQPFTTNSNLPFTDNQKGATSDQMQIHGVDGFSINNNLVVGGGEIGMTISRLSRNGKISHNRCFGNDGHGIELGSSLVVASVSRNVIVNAGESISIDTTDAKDQAITITGAVERVSQEGEAKEIWLSKIAGGRIAAGQSIKIGHESDSSAKILHVQVTESIDVIHNEAFDNGINRGKEPQLDKVISGIFVLNCDAIQLSQNSLGNRRDTKHQDYGVGVVHSTNVVIDGTKKFTDNGVAPFYQTGSSTVQVIRQD